MSIDNFKEELLKYKIELSDEQIKQFNDYASLLQEWNQKMNLTAIIEKDEIFEKHFLDSIIPALKYELRGTLCDVGAGAGFPSLPIKIVFPKLKVCIVEPLGKRVTFLNEVVKQLKLKDVEIVNARAEDFAKDHRESFDVVSARAVANLNILAELCIPLVKKNGIFLTLKGSRGDEEYELAKSAIITLGCKLEKRFEYCLSDEALRINFVFKKIKETPLKYPRNYGQIKKKPLGGTNERK